MEEFSDVIINYGSIELKLAVTNWVQRLNPREAEAKNYYLITSLYEGRSWQGYIGQALYSVDSDGVLFAPKIIVEMNQRLLNTFISPDMAFGDWSRTLNVVAYGRDWALIVQ